jgi:glyoxylase-like metal-dependent hydrolase (beta-lactamase superfamily II)
MLVKTLPVGQLEANCYIAIDEQTNKAMIVDPGDEPDRIIEEAKDVEVEFIVLTHAHFDHAGALEELKEATGASIAVHEAELPVYENIKEQGDLWGIQMDNLPSPDVTLSEGDQISLGGLAFAVIHTPGHTPGSMCLYGEGAVFTGDTLFAGSVGRTDFPGGSLSQMKDSFRRLMSLPGETAVLSGHGPTTTISREKEENMFAAEFLA